MKTIKYFSTTFCAPCRMFKPVMQELASQGVNIDFIDAEEDPLQAQNYGIRSVPTCVLVENGRELTRWTGALPKEEVLRRYNGI